MHPNLCILDEEGLLFTGFQADFQDNRRARPRSFAVIALVCLALLALLTVAQVTHTHPVSSDADHCQLCIVMHTAAPALSAPVTVTLVQVAIAAPVVEVRRVTRQWHSKLFTRPPPAAC